jgi:transcriptional regulator with XRE-family HTH domain
MADARDNPIAAGIRRAREAIEISQAELARRLAKAGKAVSREAVSQWESGKTAPETERLADIAAALGVDVAEILAGGMSPAANRSSARDIAPRDVPLIACERAPTGWPFLTLGAPIGPAPRYVRTLQSPGVFAIYAPAEFLAPWRQPGELIFFDRNRPPRRGDHVLVELVGGTAIVGELVEHDAASGAIRLRWYRPETTHRLDGARVVRIIRAIEWSELIAVA